MALNDLQHACTGAELAVGPPMRGWREWSVSPDGLRGVLGRVWSPGVNVAECHGRHATMIRVLHETFIAAGLTPPRHVVEPWCTCGLYSWRTPGSIGARADKVTGVVEMWGRVLVGERGCRAQYARVIAIAGPRHDHHPVRHPRLTHDERAEMAARYDVPYFDTLEAAATHFGERR